MGDISTWSLIASQNGTLGSPPDYWPEGQAPSTVNDCAREMMRAIKKQFLDAGWVNAGDTPTYISATKFSISSSTSTAVSYYSVGRRIRLNDATTLYATVTEASVSATTTNITATLDSGSLTASLTAVAFSVVSPSNTPLPPGTSSLIYAADAQANDTYVITPSPAIASYTTGLMLNFKANTVNTGAATINVSGLGAKTIVKPYGQTLEDGDIAAGQIATIVYDGTNFVLQSQSQRILYQNGQQIYAADAQANDTYVITLAPAITAYVAGQMFNFKANTSNTGACTLNVNGLGAKTIKKQVSTDTASGDILAGQVVTVVYDGTNFQMMSGLGSVSGGSGLVYLATATAANSAILEFNALFSATYDNYLFVMDQLVPATDAVFLYSQLGTGGVPTYVTAGYYWGANAMISGSLYSVYADNDAQINFIRNSGGAYYIKNSAPGYSGTMYLKGTNASSNGAIGMGLNTYAATSATSGTSNFGWQIGAATYTAIKFYMSSGNITSGKIRMYGIVNS